MPNLSKICSQGTSGQMVKYIVTIYLFTYLLFIYFYLFIFI